MTPSHCPGTMLNSDNAQIVNSLGTGTGSPGLLNDHTIVRINLSSTHNVLKINAEQ